MRMVTIMLIYKNDDVDDDHDDHIVEDDDRIVNIEFTTQSIGSFKCKL